ncbi:hypothetical protein B9G53_06520 [Pseudanabaena sp. SR411]|uniref:hypothetical protein n=1 Tax=Pseudanabaena sp. SR411 TaxID=1980935 RepID=UPI000B99C35C|nr:hypothetical protein [Pseudanabaena sp. SR411]OYQ65706.1 hypothetical protein B9G53_06520 [Pseudanabaena sp. SR411]
MQTVTIGSGVAKVAQSVKIALILKTDGRLQRAKISDFLCEFTDVFTREEKVGDLNFTQRFMMLNQLKLWQKTYSINL